MVLEKTRGGISRPQASNEGSITDFSGFPISDECLNETCKSFDASVLESTLVFASQNC